MKVSVYSLLQPPVMLLAQHLDDFLNTPVLKEFYSLPLIQKTSLM